MHSLPLDQLIVIGAMDAFHFIVSYMQIKNRSQPVTSGLNLIKAAVCNNIMDQLEPLEPTLVAACSYWKHNVVLRLASYRSG